MQPITGLKLRTPSAALPYFKDLLVDFEVAQAKAFINIFNGALHGCFFHFRQALQRKLNFFKKLSSKLRKDSTEELKINFNKFSALAFIRDKYVSVTYYKFLKNPFMVEHY